MEIKVYSTTAKIPSNSEVLDKHRKKHLSKLILIADTLSKYRTQIYRDFVLLNTIDAQYKGLELSYKTFVFWNLLRNFLLINVKSKSISSTLEQLQSPWLRHKPT